MAMGHPAHVKWRRDSPECPLASFMGLSEMSHRYLTQTRRPLTGTGGRIDESTMMGGTRPLSRPRAIDIRSDPPLGAGLRFGIGLCHRSESLVGNVERWRGQGRAVPITDAASTRALRVARRAGDEHDLMGGAGSGRSPWPAHRLWGERQKSTITGIAGERHGRLHSERTVGTRREHLRV